MKFILWLAAASLVICSRVTKLFASLQTISWFHYSVWSQRKQIRDKTKRKLHLNSKQRESKILQNTTACWNVTIQTFGVGKKYQKYEQRKKLREKSSFANWYIMCLCVLFLKSLPKYFSVLKSLSHWTWT